jgi:hypothetical protein
MRVRPVRAFLGLSTRLCSDGLGRFDGLHNMVRDFVNAPDAIHLGQDAPFGILGHNGLGLLVVQVQAVVDGFMEPWWAP